MTLAFPLRKRLLRLKRAGATWQLGAIRSHAGPSDSEHGYICLCVQGDRLIRAVTSIDQEPNLATWEKLLVTAMSTPARPLLPRRPAAIRIADATHAAQLGASFKSLKITVKAGGDLNSVTETLQQLADHWAAGADDLPDVQRDLSKAAVAYSKRQPWLWFSSQDGLQLSLPTASWSEPVAVVLGSGGQTFGLALYRSAADYGVTVAAGAGDAHPDDVESLALLLDEHIDIPGRRHKPAIFMYNPAFRDPEPLRHAHHGRALLLATKIVMAWMTSLDEASDPDAPFEFEGASLRPLGGLIWLDLMADEHDDIEGWLAEEDLWFNEAEGWLDDEELAAAPLDDPTDHADVERWRHLRGIEMALGRSVREMSTDRPVLAAALSRLEELDDKRLPGAVPLWVSAAPWLVHEIRDETGSLADTKGQHTRDPDAALWLEANRDAVTSVWQVQSVRVGVGLALKDIHSGEECFAIDVNLSRSAAPHTFMLARIIHIDGLRIIVGAHPAVLPNRPEESLKSELVQLHHDAVSNGAYETNAADETDVEVLPQFGTNPNSDISGQLQSEALEQRAEPAGGGKARFIGLGRARRAPKDGKKAEPNARRTCSHLVQSPQFSRLIGWHELVERTRHVSTDAAAS